VPTFPVRQLRESHQARLFSALKYSGAMVAAQTLHEGLEARLRQKIHELRAKRLYRQSLDDLLETAAENLDAGINGLRLGSRGMRYDA
jgi:hypothetical protein